MAGIIPIDGFGGGGGSGAINIPSDQIFNSVSERDAFFVSNPSKLIEGAQCVVLTNPPEGLYQVYTSGAWQDRTAVVVGPKGDIGEAVSVGDGTGAFAQVSKINFEAGLSIDVVGDTATVIAENPALNNVKSVDGIEPDIDGNVQLDALRGRINVTNVGTSTLSAGDGISIEGALADGGYSVVKHSNGLTLNGFCLDTDILAGEDGNMLISGECACIELGLNPNTPKGTKIYYDRLTAKLYTKLDDDGDDFYVGNFTDTSENVFVDASVMNSQYQSKLNYEGAINQLVNVIIPDEGKDFDSKLVFSSDAKKEEGYSSGYYEIEFEYNDKLQTDVAKAVSPYEDGQRKTQSYAFVFPFDSTSFWQYLYLIITDDQLLKMQTSGQDIGYEIGKLEYGLDFGNSIIGMGRNGAITPNPTYGGKINFEGYVIPNRSPDDINVIIDPNDSSNTYYLNSAGDVVEKSQARVVSYNKYQLVNLTSLRDQQFGYSMRRGYVYKDKTKNNELQFIPSSDSNYFVIAAGQHRVGYPGIAQSTVFIDWNNAKIFDSSIAAATSARYRSEASNYKNVETYSHEGEEYIAVDKTYPAICLGDVQKGHIVQITASLTVDGIPEIKSAGAADQISGIALSDGGDGDVVTVLEKGSYNNDIELILPQAVAGDTVFISPEGLITLDGVGGKKIGYVLESKNVFIDNDLYNASLVAGGGSGDLPTDPVFNSVTANVVKTEVIETDTTNIEFDVAGKAVANLTNDSFDLSTESHSNQGTDITGIYRLEGSGKTAHIALPNDNMVLYAEGVIALQDTGSDYIYFDRNLGLNFAGTSGYLCGDKEQNGIYIKGRNIGFRNLDGNPVLTMGNSDGYSIDAHNHKIFNLGAPTKDKDAVNKAYVDLLEGRIATLESGLADLVTQVSGLQQIIISEGQRISDLETSNGNSVTNFVMYSSKSDEVRMDMDRINGQGLTQTITLGSAPHPEPPNPPTPDEFTVYFGWDIHPRGLIEADDILNYQGTDERTANLYVTADTLLTEVYDITRQGTENKYGYVAYPKGVIDPNPYNVEYSGFVAEWPARELEINGVMYIALVSTWPNSSPNMTLKLHQ